ncbi:MAG TPA: SOS response-associated peptidase [Longimicrobiales bacterium]
MCGRYTMASPEEWIREEFDLFELPPDYRPRYNIAPSQDVLAIVRAGDGLRAGWLRWGLVPFWAKDAAIGSRMINARAETVATKPAFRDAFRRRRCLIVADGFYEWQKAGAARVPMWIHRASRRPFAFAGLWDRWQPPDGEPVVSCTIVTTGANDALRSIHERMPVILPPAARATWLDPAAEPDALAALLRPYAGDDLEAHAVSTLVNSPKNDIPECIAPA